MHEATVSESLIGLDGNPPIYQQIVRQIRLQIAGGHLHAGDRVPSVRSVSATLTVNPLTVSKAYRQLAREGLLVSLPGSGTFVAENVQSLMPESQRLSLLEASIDSLVNEAQQLGVSEEAVIAAVRERFVRRALT